MNCADCKTQLYPEDPSVGGYSMKLGKYFPPLCYCCPNEPPIEPQEVIKVVEPEGLRRLVFDLQERVNKIYRDDKYLYE